jgi:hypothetical protein
LYRRLFTVWFSLSTSNPKAWTFSLFIVLLPVQLNWVIPYYHAMGIPQLKRHLEPYAERAAIEPGDVVLDGPALAYHVLSLCSRSTRKTSPFEQPSYHLLGETAIAWLERIEACGLSVYDRVPKT